MENIGRNEKILMDIERGLSPMSKDELDCIKDGLKKAIEKRKKITEDYNLAMSESSETYHDNAPAESALLDMRVIDSEIVILQNKIDTAVLYDSENNYKKVTLGSKVSFLYEGDSSPEIVTVVGSLSADGGRYSEVSLQSPLGEAILGKVAGEYANFKVEDSNITVKIVDVAN